MPTEETPIQHPPDPRPQGPAVVRAADLVLSHGAGTVLTVPALSIPRGRVTAVTGPNGSGKSTLLGAIAGLVAPARGTLRVLGAEPGRQPGRVACLLQETAPDTPAPLTVRDTVRMGRYGRRGAWRPLRADDHRAVRRAMRAVGVAALERHRLTDLSGGQRQRVHLAQALAQEAELLLLDEPAAGLDVAARGLLARIVDHTRAAGRTIVLATHDPAAARRADLVLRLDGGTVEVGPSPRDDPVAATVRR